MAQTEFKGFKQSTKMEYDTTNTAKRKQYIWLVDDKGKGEIYLGNRKYGEVNEEVNHILYIDGDDVD